MIDLSSVSVGTISTTKQIYRTTKLKPIGTHVTVRLDVFVSPSVKEAVDFQCEDFPDLLIYNSNRDVSYFLEFTESRLENSGIHQTINKSTIDDESLIKYEIVFDRQIFIDLNLSQYGSTIRKLVKTLSGV